MLTQTQIVLAQNNDPPCRSCSTYVCIYPPQKKIGLNMTSMSSRGKKGPNHVHSLDKETRDRYFPEYNGGKGSMPRTSTKTSRQRFEDNYDKINWSK